jgi:hypothetical protein
VRTIGFAVILASAFLVYQFIRVTSYVSQAVRIERVETVCQAVKGEGKQRKMRKPRSNCAALRYQIEHDVDGLAGFELQQIVYLFFHYKAIPDGKMYEGSLPTYQNAFGGYPAAGHVMAIRVSRINHKHYMY